MVVSFDIRNRLLGASVVAIGTAHAEAEAPQGRCTVRDPVADFHRHEQRALDAGARLALGTATRRRGNALATARVGNAVANDPRTHGVHVTCSAAMPWSR